MIILHPRVTMATALAQSSLLNSESNPAQIRYKHQTEELEPSWIRLQKRKLMNSQLYHIRCLRLHQLQITTKCKECSKRGFSPNEVEKVHVASSVPVMRLQSQSEIHTQNIYDDILKMCL